MFGNSSFAEAAFANVGGVVQIAIAEMNALGTSSSIGSGTLVGVSSLSGNFTSTIEISTISSGSIDFSSLFTQTTENIAIVNFTDVTMSSIFTKTTSGDILYVAIVPTANETYTEITPSGTETWTEITPSGTETYTEINA